MAKVMIMNELWRKTERRLSAHLFNCFRKLFENYKWGRNYHI